MDGVRGVVARGRDAHMPVGTHVHIHTHTHTQSAQTREVLRNKQAPRWSPDQPRDREEASHGKGAL